MGFAAEKQRPSELGLQLPTHCRHYCTPEYVQQSWDSQHLLLFDHILIDSCHTRLFSLQMMSHLKGTLQEASSVWKLNIYCKVVDWAGKWRPSKTMSANPGVWLCRNQGLCELWEENLWRFVSVVNSCTCSSNKLNNGKSTTVFMHANNETLSTEKEILLD